MVVERATAPRAGLENPQVPISSDAIISLIGGQSSSTSGKSVTPASALTMSAVWRAVNLISTTCGGLPMHAYKPGPGNIRVQVNDGPAARLLRMPHPDLTQLELWELVYGSLCLWGNAYLLKLRNQLGVITELWWINPCRVKVYRTDAGEKRYVVDGNEEQPYSDAKMLHIPGFGYDGTSGVSPITAAREGIGLGLAAEEFGSKFFGSGSLASGLLTTEQKIDQDQAVRLKELWKQGGSGLDSAHDIRVIGSGASFQQLTIAPDDAQFLQTREFQITEVARWFGIPPHLLMQTDKATSWGTGIESQNIGLITYTLQGYIGRVEQRMTRTVEPEDVYVKVALAGLLRGDSASRAEFYTKMWNLGAFSTDDIRQFEDLAPVDGGDIRYRPLNYAPLVGTAEEETNPDPVEGDPGSEPAPVEADANPAVDAAKLAQQLYLAVGKVLTVAEARQLVAAGAGVTLAEVDALTVFENLPPLAKPLPAADDAGTEPAPDPDPAEDPDEPTEPDLGDDPDEDEADTDA